MATCTNNPTLESLNLADNEMALRVTFPLVINSVNPMGNIADSTYNIETVLLQQLSSWIPGILINNIFRKNCNIIVTTRENGFYLIGNYPENFSQYTG